MSLFLFFTLAAFIIAIGAVFSVLVIRHHWKKDNVLSSSDQIYPDESLRDSEASKVSPRPSVPRSNSTAPSAT